MKNVNGFSVTEIESIFSELYYRSQWKDFKKTKIYKVFLSIKKYQPRVEDKNSQPSFCQSGIYGISFIILHLWDSFQKTIRVIHTSLIFIIWCSMGITPENEPFIFMMNRHSYRHIHGRGVLIRSLNSPPPQSSSSMHT